MIPCVREQHCRQQMSASSVSIHWWRCDCICDCHKYGREKQLGYVKEPQWVHLLNNRPENAPWTNQRATSTSVNNCTEMSRRRTLLSHARKPVRWLNLLPYVSILVIVNDSMPMYSSQIVLRNHSNFYKHHKEVVSCHTLLDPILYQIWHHLIR